MCLPPPRFVSFLRRVMMGLLSTIRGKRDGPIIGATDAAPVAAKSKKIVIQEWPRLLKVEPALFKTVWFKSANRSTSIKKAFGIAESAPLESSASFMGLHSTIENFFFTLVVKYELDDEKVRTACEQLGRRHVDFIARGFHSNFWDIFLVCMAETIEDTVTSYISDETRRIETILAWQRVINNIIHHMRNGYSDRRKVELQTKNGGHSP